MIMKAKVKGNKSAKENLYLLKWVSLISVCLILGGVLSFGLILASIRIIGGSLPISPVWIVGMIPMMTLVAIPVTLLIYRHLVASLNPLLKGMEQVAGGELNTYLPTAEAKDFSGIYENFNKMVAEIQSASSLRTSMLDNLSHELKTPIAAINGFARILTQKDLGLEKQQKYLEIIATESERLGGLVENILLLSRLDAQEIVSDKQDLSLTAQLQECIISLEPLWAEKEISMTAELPEVRFFGDESMLRSIWQNLLTNAVKFTPRGGQICARMHVCEGHVFVEVADTGIGMTDEEILHIFERRFQASTQHRGSGQGLGLAIVKRAVKLCGGKISVTSEKGKGSIFTVELPLT